MMTQLPGLHPDSALYRTIIGTFSACAAPKMVLQVALIMAQQVSHYFSHSFEQEDGPTQLWLEASAPVCFSGAPS